MTPLIAMLGGAVVIVLLLQAIDAVYIRHRVKTRPVPPLLPARARGEEPKWEMWRLFLQEEEMSILKEIARLTKELKCYEEFFVNRVDDN